MIGRHASLSKFKMVVCSVFFVYVYSRLLEALEMGTNTLRYVHSMLTEII